MKQKANVRTEDLSQLASAWLTSGVDAFGYRSDGKLRIWPEGERGEPSVVAPVYSSGSAVGELCVWGDDSGHAQERLSSQARLLSDLLSARRHRTDLADDLAASQERFMAMCDLAVAGSQTLDLSQVLDAIAREAARLSKVESVFVHVVDQGSTITAMYPAILDQASVAETFEHVSGSRDLVNGQTVRFSDGREEEVLLTVLRREGVPVGVLGLANKPDGAFDPGDSWLAIAIASHVSAAIERAYAHRQLVGQAQLTREYELAANVQMTLVPSSVPTVDGIDVGAHYAPSLYVGGDFYDWMQAADGTEFITVGDVSGKGMSAALVMSMTQMATRTSISAGRVDPAFTAEGVNANMFDELIDIGAFVTMFFAFVDVDADELRYANAGHSPVVLGAGGAAPEVIAADGPPLGVLDALDMETVTVPFRSGDILVACSDGIPEQRMPGGEMFGYERLLALVERGRSMPAQALADLIDEAVTEFSQGEPIDDDRTIVVVRRV